MPLTCNSEAKGKAIRLIYGVALVVLGAVLCLLWARPAGTWWAWLISVACVAGGGFAVFEARAGWCVLRAVGIRTPF